MTITGLYKIGDLFSRIRIDDAAEFWRFTLCTTNQTAIINNHAENKILSNHLAEIKNELKEAKDQLKFIAQEKWELMQEKSILEGQIKQMHKFL